MRISFDLALSHTLDLRVPEGLMCHVVEVGAWSDPWLSSSIFGWEIWVLGALRWKYRSMMEGLCLVLMGKCVYVPEVLASLIRWRVSHSTIFLLGPSAWKRLVWRVASAAYHQV